MSEVPPSPSAVPPPPPAPAPPPPPPPQSPGAWAPAASTPSDVELRAGAPLADPGRRLGGYLLDILLFVVTLGIGWIVWSLVVWKDGLTPAKQILKMRVVKFDTRRVATWGTMALREFVSKGLIMGVIGAVPFVGWIAAIVLCFMLLWDVNKQELWDKIASTVVVDERGLA